MYIKIIGYFIFLLQFVWGFSHIDWTTSGAGTAFPSGAPEFTPDF